MRRALPYVLLVLAAAFAVFVWPTPYRYFDSNAEPIAAVRENRFTGKIEGLDLSEGWFSIEKSAPVVALNGFSDPSEFADRPPASTNDFGLPDPVVPQAGKKQVVESAPLTGDSIVAREARRRRASRAWMDSVLKH